MKEKKYPCSSTFFSWRLMGGNPLQCTNRTLASCTCIAGNITRTVAMVYCPAYFATKLTSSTIPTTINNTNIAASPVNTFITGGIIAGIVVATCLVLGCIFVSYIMLTRRATRELQVVQPGIEEQGHPRVAFWEGGLSQEDVFHARNQHQSEATGNAATNCEPHAGSATQGIQHISEEETQESREQQSGTSVAEKI